MADTNPDRGKLDIVIGETGRLEKMLKDMLDFSKPLQIDRSDVQISNLIRECIEIAADVSQKNKVKILNRSSDHLPSCPVDSFRLKQAILNLVMNAIEASPEGETVTINPYFRGRQLIIDVSDCGCGIPAEKREDIFTPFFTTKKHGTGLGLPIIKKIVEAHQGKVQVIDNPTRGLTFRVVIPNLEQSRSDSHPSEAGKDSNT